MVGDKVGHNSPFRVILNSIVQARLRLQDPFLQLRELRGDARWMLNRVQHDGSGHPAP